MNEPPQDHKRLDNTTTRLYISPFSPSLLTTYLPANLQPLAQNISFHSIETFPEKPYGYLDLPSSEAQKIKRKLNGSIIKGMKLRVEDARPEKRRRDNVGNEQEEANPQRETMVEAEGKTGKRSKRRDRSQDDTLPGVELPDGRKVKRGWSDTATETRKSKRQRGITENSGGDEKSSLKFRTKLPPNVASNAADEGFKKGKKKGEESKSKSGKIVEITEFTKQSKTPSFLRSSKPTGGPSHATSFVDGKGWLDEDGNLVEAVTTLTVQPAAADVIKRKPSRKDESSDTSSSSDSSSHPELETTPTAIEEQSIITSTEQATELPPSSADPPTDPSPSSPPQRDEQPSKPVHPLEAIFKRPSLRNASTTPPAPATKPTVTPRANKNVPRPAPIKTSFSFFADKESGSGDEGDSRTTTLHLPPQTPFTQRDLEGRSVRSAAPTPDTAAIGKRFPPWGRGNGAASSSSPAPLDEEEEDDDDDDIGSGGEVDEVGLGGGAEADEDVDMEGTGAAAAPKQSEEKEQTEFEKHFYAHRGEYNRAWKARKREARKEARRTENRRRSRR